MMFNLFKYFNREKRYFKEKKKNFEELINVYIKLKNIDWNDANHNKIQDLNFEFKRLSEKYEKNSPFSLMILNNIVELKRIGPSIEQYSINKDECLFLLYTSLEKENNECKYNFEIPASLSYHRFDFTKKEDIKRFLERSFVPFKTKYSDISYRAKLIFENEIYKNVLVIEKDDLNEIELDDKSIIVEEVLVEIHKLKESDFKKTEKILII